MALAVSEMYINKWALRWVMLLTIILATLIISLISLIGIIISHKNVKKFLHYFISFAAGTLIAVAFFDLIPEAVGKLEEAGMHIDESVLFIVAGILIFFLVERYIHWHHCGKHECKEKPAGMLILMGDFVHNFIDGVLIAGAFMLGNATGIITTVSVAVHEIPQELGDFSVLIHSGFSKVRALYLNFVSALSAVIGGVIGFFVFNSVNRVVPYAVLIAAGGFIYVALSDIMPSLHHHKQNKSIVLNETIIFVLTLVGMYFLLGVLHNH